MNTYIHKVNIKNVPLYMGKALNDGDVIFILTGKYDKVISQPVN